MQSGINMVYEFIHIYSVSLNFFLHSIDILLTFEQLPVMALKK